MNRAIYFTITLLSLFLLSSCDKEINNTLSNIQGTNWKLIRFIENGKDETPNFNNGNYVFTSRNLTVTRNSETNVGIWVMIGTNDDLNLQIDFPDIDPMNKFNKLWLIVKSSSEELQLQNVNPNGDVSILTFSK